MNPSPTDSRATRGTDVLTVNTHGGLRGPVHPGATLSQRAVRGGFWVFALRVVHRLLALARIIVLAHLLTPDDFGLFAIALLALSALETFSQTGFEAALVQKKGNVKPYLDTAWTVQVIRGVTLVLVLFTVAPYVARFFGEPMARPLLRALGLSMLFQSFANIGVVHFRKELEFHKEFLYQVSGTVVDFVVAIGAAVALRNAWALVAGLVAGSLVRMAVSYLIHPFRPRLRLDKEKAGELYRFGRWILGSSIINFLNTEGDDAFLGKVLGITSLGLYQMAYRLSNLPATEITHVISQVTFPAYCQLQDRLPRLREAYLRALQVTAGVSFPAAGALFFLASDLTRIFLGDRWMPMVPAMRLLTLWGLTRSLGATTGPLLNALGRPQVVTTLQAARLAQMAVLIYPLTVRWGMMGTSLAVVLSALFTNLFALYVAMRSIRCALWRVSKVILVPAGGTVVMLGVLSVTRRLWFAATGLPSLLLLCVIGGLVYVAAFQLFNSSLRHSIIATISPHPRGGSD